MTIHREGFSILFISLVILFGINWLIGYMWPDAPVIQNIAIGVSVILYLVVLQFFRNPIFEIRKNDKQVLAPADGKVVVIEETVENEYFKTKRR